MKKDKKPKIGKERWYFLLIVLVVYLIAWIFKREMLMPSLAFSFKILARIWPVFILVFVFMLLVNYFITPQLINRFLGRSSGIKRWAIAIIGGIISTGPIFIWYPILRGLKDKGVGFGFIAAFLYNRAIKPALIPVLVFYFGLRYTLVLTFAMVVFSLIIGIIFEKMEAIGFLGSRDIDD